MQYLEQSDLSKLFRVMYAANRTHHLAALAQYFTGARIDQILRLQGQDVFKLDGRMVVKIHSAKKGYDRVHNLHADDRPEFDMTPLIGLAKSRPVARLFGGLTRQYQNLKLKEYCVAAGLHTDFGHTHVFRHSCAMEIWTATQRLGTISHFLGHRSPATACFYLAEADGKMAQVAMDNVKFA